MVPERPARGWGPLERLQGLSSNPALFAILLVSAVAIGMGLLACRDMYWGDSAEFAFIASNPGIAHPSGYPLYSMLIRLVALFPLPLYWSLSLLSVAFTAMASLVLFAILTSLGLGPWAAACTLVFTLFGTSFIDQSTIPEVYSLHLFLQVLIIHRALICRVSPRSVDWAILGFCIGLAFSNHLTTFWLLLPLLVLLWDAPSKEMLKRISIATAACVIGLLPYLYLPILSMGDPIWNQGDPSSLGSFFDLVSGRIYRYRLFSLDAAELADQVAYWADSLSDQWSIWALIFLPFGLISIYRNYPGRVVISAGLWLLIGLIYVFNYFIPDKQGYYLTSHLLLGLSIAAGAGMLAKKIMSMSGRRWVEGVVSIALVVAALVPMILSAEKSRDSNSSLRDLCIDSVGRISGRALLLTEDINLHYGTELLVEEGVLSGDVAVVSIYWLGFDWYHDFLRKRYPFLELPGDYAARGRRFIEKTKHGKGKQAGTELQRIVQKMADDLIRENYEKLPVYIYAHDKKEPDRRFKHFRLQNIGLLYTVVDKIVPELPGECDYSAKYLAGKREFSDDRDIHLVSLYATACNRLGIELVEKKRFGEALTAFDRALRYDDAYLEVMKNKGLVLARDLKDEKAAKKIWQRYLLLAGDNADEGVVRWMRQRK